MTEDEALELKFLRYFYDVASDAMGPADDDIYYMIKSDFKAVYSCALPSGYYDADEEEEEEGE